MADDTPPRVIAYVVADDTRCRFLSLSDAGIPRWVADQARATRFPSKREADIQRDTLADGYITVGLVRS